MFIDYYGLCNDPVYLKLVLHFKQLQLHIENIKAPEFATSVLKCELASIEELMGQWNLEAIFDLTKFNLQPSDARLAKCENRNNLQAIELTQSFNFEREILTTSKMAVKLICDLTDLAASAEQPSLQSTNELTEQLCKSFKGILSALGQSI